MNVDKMVNGIQFFFVCSTDILLPFLTPHLLSGVTDQLVDALNLLRERAENDEPNTLFSLVNDLSKVNKPPYLAALIIKFEDTYFFYMYMEYFQYTMATSPL